MDGMRFFSMAWVISCHCFSLYAIMAPVNNLLSLPDILSDISYRPILNGFPSVDSFFMLSGVLVGYLTFKELDKNKGKLNIPMFYIHRYLRLTAAYAILTGYHATLYKYWAFGPLNFVEDEVQSCKRNWWRNFLYINNFRTENNDSVSLDSLYCTYGTYILYNLVYNITIRPQCRLVHWPNMVPIR